MNAAKGFTLIEVLVALAILSLLAVVSFESLRFATRAWTTTVSRATAADEIWTAQRFLRGRLEQLYPRMPSADPVKRMYAVEGEEDEAVFSTRLPASGPGDELYRFKIFLRGTPAKDLWVAWRPEGDVRQEGEWREEKLLTHVRQARWDYLEIKDDQPPRWVPRWSGQTQAPAALRLRIDFDPGDRRYWPDLVVRPRLTATPDCSFDFVSRRCQSPI